MSDRIECRKQRPGAISEGIGEQREHEIQRQVYIGKGSEAQGLEKFRVGVLGEKCGEGYLCTMVC